MLYPHQAAQAAECDPEVVKCLVAISCHQPFARLECRFELEPDASADVQLE